MERIIKKLTYLLFLINFFSYAQDLTILSGTSLTVKSGTNLYVNGIDFSPSAELTITGPTDFTKTSVALNPESINRVFNFNNPINGFIGDLTFYYEVSELNGVTEADLILQSNNGTSWSGDLGASLNTSLKTLTHNFGSATNLASVTASKSGVTLSISKLNQLKINLFPNPVVSSFQISTELTIETLIFNNLGQEVFRSNKKDIDVSQLSAGTYLIIVKDLNSSNYNTYQIIKI